MRISDWSSDVCSSDLFFGLAPKVRQYFRSEASVSSRRQLAFRQPSLLMWTRPPFPLASWPKVPCLTLNEWRYSRAPKGRYLDRTPRAALLILSSQSQPMKSPPDLMPNMVVFNPSSLVVSSLVH